MSFEKLKEKTTESIMNDLRKTMLNDNGLEFKGSISKEVALKKWVAKSDVLAFLEDLKEQLKKEICKKICGEYYDLKIQDYAKCLGCDGYICINMIDKFFPKKRDVKK